MILAFFEKKSYFRLLYFEIDIRMDISVKITQK